MSVAFVQGMSFDGYQPIDVRVEVSAKKGLPTFDIVGMGQREVKEGRDRIRSALSHAGVVLKNKKIVVNLAPADVPKSGAYLDLPIAIAVMRLMGLLEGSWVHDAVCFGELSLDGHVRGVRGGLAMAGTHQNQDISIVYPYQNHDVSACVGPAKLCPIDHLSELIASKDQAREPVCFRSPMPMNKAKKADHPCMSQVKGQTLAKRMLLIAAAGRHHMMMSGPPGVGKSLLAKVFPGLLPPLSRKEQVEVLQIQSAWGLDQSIRDTPPIRTPHHHATLAGMIGGGTRFQAGDFMLAHRGILFMDEFPEFRRDVIEALREPLEEKNVVLRRASGTYAYPCAFQLLAAMNLCPCGNTGDPSQVCTCSASQVEKYQKKCSKPILDRIDVFCSLPKVHWQTVWNQKESKTSAAYQKEVVQARARAQARWGQDVLNADVGLLDLKTKGKFEQKTLDWIEEDAQQANRSVRSMIKVLKVARTVADLEQAEYVRLAHVQEALLYSRPSTG